MQLNSERVLKGNSSVSEVLLPVLYTSAFPLFFFFWILCSFFLAGEKYFSGAPVELTLWKELYSNLGLPNQFFLACPEQLHTLDWSKVPRRQPDHTWQHMPVWHHCWVPVPTQGCLSQALKDKVCDLMPLCSMGPTPRKVWIGLQPTCDTSHNCGSQLWTCHDGKGNKKGHSHSSVAKGGCSKYCRSHNTPWKQPLPTQRQSHSRQREQHSCHGCPEWLWRPVGGVTSTVCCGACHTDHATLPVAKEAHYKLGSWLAPISRWHLTEQAQTTQPGLSSRKSHGSAASCQHDYSASAWMGWDSTLC